jgi:hypothetical protein
MRLFFERTGGFAGMKLRRAFDSDELPPGDARRLGALLRQSRFFELPPELQSSSSHSPDRFHYKLTVENEAGIRTVEASEASVPEEMRPLIDWLTRFCRP